MSNCNFKNSVNDYRSGSLSIPLAILMALLPKCSICWTAYLSAISGIGVISAVSFKWILPCLIGLSLVNLIFIAYRSICEKQYFLLIVNLTGLSLIIVSKLQIAWQELGYLAFALIITGSVWNLLMVKFNLKSTF